MTRISQNQALDLYQTAALHELGRRAHDITESLHPGGIRSYVIERNINYTNICRCRCGFCAFSVPPFQSKIQNLKSKIENQNGYVLSQDVLFEKIRVLRELGGNQVLWQGGLNPELRLSWHEAIIGALKRQFPGLHLHGYSPPELNFLAELEELPLETVLARLREAGLDSIPGGGAEILVDRVRRLIAPAKGAAAAWLQVMRAAHRLGIWTTATMMFGHVETLAERIEHLDRLRILQDESLDYQAAHPSAAAFTAFTCWPFQPGNTRLARRLNSRESRVASHESKKPNSGLLPPSQFKIQNLKSKIPNPNPQSAIRNPQFFPAGAFEQLKMSALARIYLDNLPHIQASWVTQGPQIAQLSLALGCDDLGSLMIEENVVAAAGTVFTLQLAELRELIRSAGFSPRPRDFYYQLSEP